jgi:hypothetical protein
LRVCVSYGFALSVIVMSSPAGLPVVHEDVPGA